MRPLVSHGFLDIELHENLTNICEVLPKAKEIARLGPEQKVSGDTWRFLNRGLEHVDEYVGWHIGELYREGTYGKIYKAHRMLVKRRADGLFDVIEAPTEVIVKRTMPPAGSDVLPEEDVTAHTSESLLHVLAWQTMLQTVTPWAIPRPFEVFGEAGPASVGWKQMSLCMSYVHGRTLYSFMQKIWSKDTKEANSRTFLEIMAQTAFILHHLQNRLRLNHRDVKVNNILIRKGSGSGSGSSSPVILELGGLSFASEYELTLIDFGFACVGCPPPKAPTTAFQAGSWFPMGELCCKAGRDLAQLVFCIHCYFPITEYLTAPVVTAVKAWMQIPWSGGVANALEGFTKEGRPRRAGAKGAPEYNTGIYEFLRRPDVDPTTCSPIAIFKACQGLVAAAA
jgi:serine/threonine protein kinase